ncbi:MAG: PspC domain-containing protein [Lactobacillales bacterium]|jgi:phage shock protein PspC (stress-responsive transcriptional regulator)|nr:PspC domain-containing protein [Lactobacillales bacterium]
MKTKRLTKSNNVVITGTLSGIAEYFGIDPTILRLIFVLLCIFGVGSPILLYIVLAIIIPRAPRKNDYYGHNNSYYTSNSGAATRPRKEADKIDDDDEWGDF